MSAIARSDCPSPPAPVKPGRLGAALIACAPCGEFIEFGQRTSVMRAGLGGLAQHLEAEPHRGHGPVASSPRHESHKLLGGHRAGGHGLRGPIVDRAGEGCRSAPRDRGDLAGSTVPPCGC